MSEDGVLRVRFIGNVDREDAEAYLGEYQRYLQDTEPGKPLHFLVDATDLGKFSAAARKLWIDAFRDPDPRIGNTALVGASRYVRVLSGFVLKAVGRENVKLFATEKEALAWLASGDRS
jgi:hypothetical protein